MVRPTERRDLTVANFFNSAEHVHFILSGSLPRKFRSLARPILTETA